MTLNSTLTLIMVCAAVLFALLSVALVAWQPTRVRPLDVLRNE